LNASQNGVLFHLPAHRSGIFWQRILDTGESDWRKPYQTRSDRYRLGDRSVAVFRVAEE